MSITSSSLTESIKNGLLSFWCAGLNATDPFEEPLYNLLRAAALTKGPVGLAGAELAIVGVKQARKYAKRFACNDPDGPEPDFGPGFSGGQCSFVYIVETEDFYINPETGEQNPNAGGTSTIERLGPIVGINEVPTAVPGSFSWQLIFNGGAGSTQIGAGPKSTQFGIRNFRILSVVPRSASDVDDCGDPPETLPDGSDSIGGELDIEGVDENGDPVSLPGEPFILFAPTININGDIISNVYFPGLDVCGLFRIGDGAEFVPQSCGPRNKPRPPRDTEPVGDGTDEPDEDYGDDDPEEQVDEDETIVGCFVKSQAKIANPFQGQAPNGSGPALLIPRIAQVSYKVEWELESEAVTGWTEPVDIKSVDAYIAAPKGCRVLVTSVQWQPNWEGTYQNVVQPYPEPCCGESPPGEPPPPP